MKIDAPGSVRTNSVRRTGKAAAGGGSDFATHVASEGQNTPAAGSANAGAQIGSVEALVALQAMPDATKQQKSPEHKRAEDLLDRLDQIRLGILRGDVSPLDLQALLRRLSEQRRSGGDPRLIAILDEIELRAKVELAKLSML